MNTNPVRSTTVLGIRARLFIGFLAIAIIIFIAIGIVLYKTDNVETFSTKVINEDAPTHDALTDLRGKMYDSQVATQSWLLSQNVKYKEEFNRSWRTAEGLMTSIDRFAKNWNIPEEVTLWQEIKSQITQLKTIQTRINNIADSKNAITQFDGEGEAQFNKVLDMLDGTEGAAGNRIGGLIDIQGAQLKIKSEAIIADLDAIRYIEYALLILTIIASIVIALYTTRGILKHVNIFRSHSGRIASGDLTQRINVESNDEIGQLGKDLNTMTDSLATITKQITEATHHMVTTLEEVRHAVDAQSSGASEQASSINEITASLEEIEKSSTQTMEKAQALGEVAERTREKGQLGLEAVEQSVSGMKTVRDKVQTIAQTILELSTQTQQVGEITAVVNTLAQQSKMLALNASIEAAKAGEAGKGFAVVAAEVKNLAEQSEQSTTQVQKILEDIRHATEKAVMATEEGTKGVDLGTNLVEQTGEIVRSLTDVIHETTVATQQIEAAVRQEGVGIEQITAGMNEINQVTASFVESVKQTTEAMANLADITKSLKNYIEMYKV